MGFYPFIFFTAVSNALLQFANCDEKFRILFHVTGLKS